MKLLLLFFLAIASFTPVTMCAQGLNPAALLDPATNTWPTYNGDYTGRRYSPLSLINKTNVHTLTLAWAFQTHAATIKSTPLEVNGTLYFTVPDNVWAVDAVTGRQIWHFRRPSQGDHIGSRGVAMYKGRLYFGTPDAHLICLDARDGKPIWDIVVADVTMGYFVSVAPLVVKDLVVFGTSGDSADVPHFLIAINPETGKTVWKWNSVPLHLGDPGSNTWPTLASMNHGGGSMWVTGTYDPALNLIYWGTGNPHPVLDGLGRLGDNLFTCSIVAIHADTGKLAWYFQASPHDTHDWDAVETPVLVDGEFHGKPRKLLLQASRNGYFFVLDRVTGKNLLTTKFVDTDWALRIDEMGRPIPNPALEPQRDGALIEGTMDGATNWMAPSFDPETRMFYVNAQTSSAIWYLSLNSENRAADHPGGTLDKFWENSSLEALNYQTGKILWHRNLGAGFSTSGVLTTAGHLLFSGDTFGNIFALDPATGDMLWHIYGGGVLNSSPMTYELDGKQYIITGVDGVIYAWTLPPSP